MIVNAFKTQIVSVSDKLTEILDKYLPPIAENSVVAVTSKIVSVCEGRIIPDSGKIDKRDLIHQEADLYLEDPQYYDKYHISITVKNSNLIASSGVDESNGNGNFILWPNDPYKSAKEIWMHLKIKNSLKKLGVIITDSHTTPLRWGVTGTALAWCGFEPLYDYTGKPDIFNRPFKFEKTSMVDSLATCATLVMGEGNEQTPLAVISEIPFIKFNSNPPTRAEIESLHIDIQDDIYAPLLTHVAWQKSKSTK
jgi:dihydrofolate synthase / folylpolyglutamate synthase